MQRCHAKVYLILIILYALYVPDNVKLIEQTNVYHHNPGGHPMMISHKPALHLILNTQVSVCSMEQNSVAVEWVKITVPNRESVWNDERV